MAKNNPSLAELMVAVLLISVSMAGVVYQGRPGFEGPEASGQLIPMASATVEGPLEKHVGELVQFKAKVKNTGSVEAKYIIVVKWSEGGTEEWESAGYEDVVLGPDQYETIVVGSVECTEWMMGKHFDVKFILYEAEAERVLDVREFDKAWFVVETTVLGSIAGCWIE